jgi:methyl-accepting chemotaxis protein
MHSIVDSSVKKQNLASQIAFASSELRGGARGIIMRGYQKDQAGIEKDRVESNEFAETLQSNINSIQPLLFIPANRQALVTVQECLTAMRDADQIIIQASKDDDMDRAISVYTNSFKPAQLQLSEAAEVIIKAQNTLMSKDTEDSYSSITTNRWATALLLGLACAVGVVLFFIIRQINTLLRETVSELSESTVQIAAAAGQVSASSQSLAQGSSEQAATIEETSSASAEINSMAQRNTENSRTTAEMVTQSQSRVEQTNKSLSEMVDAMEGINASSQKISKIIKVIDEIAFQTNILALNAAVEAARAGEAGMGFAVVADEVRNLSQRCAQAAKDTADLIEESIVKSASGRAKVDQVATAIHAITAESSKIKVLVDEISLGSVEQSRGIEHIARSITQMEQVTQSSAAGAEQGAAAAEQLNAQAETMKDVVDRLRSMVDGSTQLRAVGLQRR